MTESERYRVALLQITLLTAKLYKSKPVPEPEVAKLKEPGVVKPKEFDFDVFFWSDIGELFRFLRGKFQR